jgi:hypothetical protein
MCRVHITLSECVNPGPESILISAVLRYRVLCCHTVHTPRSDNMGCESVMRLLCSVGSSDLSMLMQTTSELTYSTINN